MSYSSNPASSAPTNTGSTDVLYKLFPRFPYVPNPHMYTNPWVSIMPPLSVPISPEIDVFTFSNLVGYIWFFVAVVPNLLLLLLPHVYVSPFFIIAIELPDPAFSSLMSVRLLFSVFITVGEFLLTVVPSPNWPFEFAPMLYPVPSFVRNSAWFVPSDTLRILSISSFSPSNVYTFPVCVTT